MKGAVKGAYSGKVAPLKSPVYIVSIVVEIFGFVSSPVGSGQKGPWKWPWGEKVCSDQNGSQDTLIRHFYSFLKLPTAFNILIGFLISINRKWQPNRSKGKLTSKRFVQKVQNCRVIIRKTRYRLLHILHTYMYISESRWKFIIWRHQSIN